ncbi:MAG: hypothetical protein ACKOTF_09685, partial [Opitutaceae bacterium]
MSTFACTRRKAPSAGRASGTRGANRTTALAASPAESSSSSHATARASSSRLRPDARAFNTMRRCARFGPVAAPTRKNPMRSSKEAPEPTRASSRAAAREPASRATST